MPTVLKYLDTSFENITYQDYLLLREAPQCLTTVTPHEQGWWVYAPEHEILDDDARLEMRKAGFSKSFIRLMELAATHDCGWIRFALDGESISSLETYRWVFLPEDARKFFGR